MLLRSFSWSIEQSRRKKVQKEKEAERWEWGNEEWIGRKQSVSRSFHGQSSCNIGIALCRAVAIVRFARSFPLLKFLRRLPPSLLPFLPLLPTNLSLSFSLFPPLVSFYLYIYLYLHLPVEAGDRLWTDNWSMVLRARQFCWNSWSNVLTAESPGMCVNRNH